MFELLAVFALLSTPEAAPYNRPALGGFVAIANSRRVDGIGYGDASAGAALLWSHPAGLYAGAEVFGGRGDGVSLPDERLLGTQAFVGISTTIGGQRIALELLDYRLRLVDNRDLDNQGVGLRYQAGGFHAEFGLERDRPYYYARLGQFFDYDNRRLGVGWEQPLGGDLRWSVGAGASHADRIDVTYRFAAASLHGRWEMLDWQFGYTYATDELESFYGSSLDRSGWLLRVAMPFQAF